MNGTWKDSEGISNDNKVKKLGFKLNLAITNKEVLVLLFLLC